jgi:PAT family beta-lactamase induction signal transducer AmpG
MSLDLLVGTSRRRFLFFALYVCEGAPIGYLWTALPTKLRAADVPVEQIAALGALLTVPWTFKFLWAPAVDALRSRRFGLRPWIAGAQLAMALTILPLARELRPEDLGWLTPLLLLHAVCAATQDVAIDALAVRRIPAGERGTATGWMQLGMVLGRVAFGGLALWAEAYVGPVPVVTALAILLAGSAALSVLARDHLDPGEAARGALERITASAALLGRALRMPGTLLGLGFAAVSGAGMEVLAGLAGPMLVDQGLDAAQVGRFLAVSGVVGLGGGSLLGGMLADRVSRVRAAGTGLVAVAAGACAVAFGLDSLSTTWLLGVLGATYLLFGLLTAATYALMMDLTDPRVGGTQFSAFMGAVNFCYVWSVALGGQLVPRVGYPGALLAAAACSLLGLALLPGLRARLHRPRPPRPADGAAH